MGQGVGERDAQLHHVRPPLLQEWDHLQGGLCRGIAQGDVGDEGLAPGKGLLNTAHGVLPSDTSPPTPPPPRRGGTDEQVRGTPPTPGRDTNLPAPSYKLAGQCSLCGRGQLENSERRR